MTLLQALYALTRDQIPAHEQQPLLDFLKAVQYPGICADLRWVSPDDGCGYVGPAYEVKAPVGQQLTRGWGPCFLWYGEFCTWCFLPDGSFVIVPAPRTEHRP